MKAITFFTQEENGIEELSMNDKEFRNYIKDYLSNIWDIDELIEIAKEIDLIWNVKVSENADSD